MRRGLVVGILLALILAPGTLLADSSSFVIKPGLLFQPRMDLVQDGNPAGDGWGNDLYLKRTRFMLSGSVNDWIGFFAETDIPNYGKAGDWSPRLFLQDAIVMFKFMKEFRVDVGMIIPSFTHHNKQGATSLNTVDYQNLYSRGFPAGQVWRDVGVEIRGIVMDKLDYRLGIFQGVRDTSGTGLNPSELPRITVRAAYNLFDVEDGLFYGGIYHGTKKVVSFGVGADLQPEAVFDDKGKPTMYLGVGGDIFVDLPMGGDTELIGQANVVYFKRGYTPNDDGTAFVESAGSGLGVILEGGYRWKAIEPVAVFEMFMSEQDGADSQNIKVGVNYWIMGHNANVKLEYGLMKTGDQDRFSQILLQAQLLYL